MHKTHLIFLHGALGCQLHWHKISALFEREYVVHTPDFPGHGNSTEELNPPTYKALAEWLKVYLHTQKISNYGIIGYSMGGYIGLEHLLNSSSDCQFLISLATKLEWNQEIAEHEAANLTIENLQGILDKLKSEHLISTEQLLQNTKDILLSIGKQPIESSRFTHNKIPVYMLLGSRDRMVTESEIKLFQTNHSQFHFQTLENQPHLLERMEAEVVGESLRLILKSIN